MSKDLTLSQFCQDKGGINTQLTGRWIGEFQSIASQGKKNTGRLNSKVQPNGIYEGLIENHQEKRKGITLGGFCNNNQFLATYEYNVPKFKYEYWLPEYTVQSSNGSIKKITPTLIEGSSIERDENNIIISRTYFRLRKQ